MVQLKRIELDCKTGFRNTGSSPIVILDEFQRDFYDTSLIDNKVWEFNLPAGEYYVLSGKFQQMASPVNYPLMPLPKKQRHMAGNPENFTINYLNNPNSASIHWDEHRIVFDKSMRSLSFPDLLFILYHEYGHRFYIDEKSCDAYAMNRMLREGFNPSQIGNAIINTLSDNNMHRKEILVDQLILNK